MIGQRQLLTALLNNVHTAKQRKLDRQQEKELQEQELNVHLRTVSLQKYLAGIATVMNGANPDTVRDYSEAYGNAFLYLPNEVIEDAQQFDWHVQRRKAMSDEARVYAKAIKDALYTKYAL